VKYAKMHQRLPFRISVAATLAVGDYIKSRMAANVVAFCLHLRSLCPIILNIALNVGGRKAASHVLWLTG